MKSKITAIALVIALALVGCGASFSVTPTDFEKYANSNGYTYSEETEENLSDYDVQNIATITNDLCSIELWTFNSGADKWFTDTIEYLKKDSKGYSGSTTFDSGDYTFLGDGSYRVLFCDNLGIKASGDKEAIEAALRDLNIVDQESE